VDGKYVVIRGLSDRYVKTLLNEGRLPTSDPDKRAVNVDLFPGSVLQSINTSKTFTPDQAGDFTGGSVDIRTKQFPEKPSFGMSVAVEYNSQSTFNPDYLTYEGGGTGPFGFRANQRQIPESVLNDPVLSSLPAANPETLDISNPGDLEIAQNINDAQIELSPVAAAKRQAPGPNYSVNLQGGDSVEFGPDQFFGAFGAFSYKREYSYLPEATRANYETQNSLAGFQLIPTLVLSDDKGTEDVLWGTLLGLGYQPEKDQKISMNILFNEQASDVTDFQTSDSWFQRNPANGQQAQFTTLQYGERQLVYLQANGEHVVKPLRRMKIDWVGSLGQAKLNEPDQRLFQTMYLTNSGVYTPFSGAGGDDPTFTQSSSPLQRYSRELSEDSYN
jgi:hypothetical protein